ncbi:scaffold protein ILK-like [Ptychodera flava]|uniref:scaffold protein ILK-like n=1 Tax=Ptychodera flava TaxID=63121 RepID=UPI00396A20AD
MDDIFSQVREGNTMYVRQWLENMENDLNQGDDHGFSLLHWAAMEGRTHIVDMLIQRGAKINITNMGDDIALHLAASHGYRDILLKLLQHKANINAQNEHGNTPLHYACFWSHFHVAEELVNNGALISIENRYGETPLDNGKPDLARILKERATALGQDLTRIPYRENNWRGTKTRSRDGTLSRHSGIDYKEIKFGNKISAGHNEELWKGMWQGTEVVAKVLKPDMTPRIPREFQEEFPRLRIFSHPNVLPVLGCVNQPPNLVVLNEYMPFGSLFNVLHKGAGIVVDQAQAINFAIDIARGMQFLHNLEPMIPRLYLSSKLVMIDEDLSAKINMADYKFSFQNRGKLFNTAWSAPEAMQRWPDEMNVRAADMWSFAILLWELSTRDVPFAGMSNMEIGMKVVCEGLRIVIPPGISPHLAKLIRICMNEDPAKRPKFDMILPILEKMKNA